MGKKSRAKQERKRRQGAAESNIERILRSRMKQPADEKFVQDIDSLCATLSQFDRGDMLTSILVSDLWLGNVASLLKHQLLYVIVLGLPANADTGRSLDSYSSFSELMFKLHGLLPPLAMLEDFVPEPDWGEISVWLGSERYYTLYGGSVERITDFIDAFLLKHADSDNYAHANQGVSPLDDLERTLMLVDHLVRSLPRSLQKIDTSMLEGGHIEVPPEQFWLKTRQAIAELVQGIPDDEFAKRFVAPETYVEGNAVTYNWFGNAAMTGQILPFLFARTDRGLIPVSPRHATSVVMEHWAERRPQDVSVATERYHYRFGQWLGRRIPQNLRLWGDLALVVGGHEEEGGFSGTIVAGNTLYLVKMLEAENMDQPGIFDKQLESLDRAIGRVLKDRPNWAIGNRTNGLLAYLNPDFMMSSYRIEVIGILGTVSTISGTVSLPKLQHVTVWPLTDAITVFDTVDDLEELERFISFVDRNARMGSAMVAAADWLGAFRDTSEVLVAGATAPNMVFIDPHWGSQYRYQELVAFWAAAPRRFPDIDARSWKTRVEKSGVCQLISRSQMRMMRVAPVKTADVFIEPIFEKVGRHDGRFLEMFAECLADGLATREDHLEAQPLFSKQTLNTRIYLGTGVPVDRIETPADKDSRIWIRPKRISSEPTDIIEIEVDLDILVAKLENAKDARLEVEVLLTWLELAANQCAVPLLKSGREEIEATRGAQPRFFVSTTARQVAFPEYAKSVLPRDTDYKLARQRLAVHFQEMGTKPGRYELEQAKEIINEVRVRYLAEIEQGIERLNRDAALTWLLVHYEALAHENWSTRTRVRLSLNHEVDYDREEHSSKEQASFTRDSRNYCYLIEKFLSRQSVGTAQPELDVMQLLLANADWLMTLYQASDVLHYGIDVGGVEIEHDFIPAVFYSEFGKEKETLFARELAQLRLGIGTAPDDLEACREGRASRTEDLEEAMLFDAGFSLQEMLAGFEILANWPDHQEGVEVAASYQATAEEISNALSKQITDFPQDAAVRLVDFLTIRSDLLLSLVGQARVETDVPVWEHYKRDYRLNIRPLLPFGGTLNWGLIARKEQWLSGANR